MARYDDLSTGPIAYAAFVSTVLLLVLILLFRALCYSYVEAEDVKKLVDSHYMTSDAEIARQKSQISNYAKVEVAVAAPESGAAGAPSESAASDAQPKMEERLHIPVARAEELLLKDWAKEAGANK